MNAYSDSELDRRYAVRAALHSLVLAVALVGAIVATVMVAP